MAWTVEEHFVQFLLCKHKYYIYISINENYNVKTGWTHLDGFIFSISFICYFATPDNGTGYSNNKMTCSDGRIAYCPSNEERYAPSSLETTTV